jgi:hypothetical protein
MKPEEIKQLIIGSLDSDADPMDVSTKLENEGVSFDFGKGFSDSILNKLFPAVVKVSREIEYLRYMHLAFRGIAISGIAAIVLLLISIFMMEGTISVNSILGMRDSYDESIICLLTGK